MSVPGLISLNSELSLSLLSRLLMKTEEKLPAGVTAVVTGEGPERTTQLSADDAPPA